MQTPLKVIELSKDYNGKEAVKNISFNLNKNEDTYNFLSISGCMISFPINKNLEKFSL